MDSCKICNRPLGTENVDKHHLLPKTFKGKSTTENLHSLHRICHNAIHSHIPTRDLLKYYHTFERILEREDMQKFVSWVKNKPLDFYVGTKKSTGRKKHR